MGPVFVLLWNHALARIRSIYRSIFTVFFVPVLIFLFIDLLSNQLPRENEKLTYPEPFELGQSESQGLLRILYEPETHLTNQLMERVGAKLNLSRLDHMPAKHEKGYFPFSNMPSSSILKFSKSMTPTDAIVKFEGMESDDMPLTLKYTIRMKDNLKTQKYNFIPVEHSNWLPNLHIETQDTSYLHLQWAIDTSYISMRSNSDVDQILMLQVIPDEKAKNKKAEFGCLSACIFLPWIHIAVFTYLTDTLFDGKNSGIHELIKMVGVSWEALCVSHVLDVVPDLLMYAVGGTIFFKVTGIVRKTSWCFITVAMTLHFVAMVPVAFVVVYAFKMTDHLTLLSSGLCFLIWILTLINLPQSYTPIFRWVIDCFMPNMAFERFWVLLAAKESAGSEVNISNMWNDNFVNKNDRLISVGNVFLCLSLQIVFFFLLAGYLAKVWPGKFGQALPWNFPCSKDYWTKKPRPLTEPEEAQLINEGDQRYFEKTPVGLPVGIQIINVHKSFGKDVVLQGVNLAVYKGEITILLGHNGAGKTTLISIITGLISATSGRVLVEGKDTVTQAAEVRKTIGLCPQQNIFFSHLTVLQHVMFFSMLKGESYAQSKVSATALLEKLQLANSAKLLTEKLSGGMKRRVQFACAVTGGATVLIMDEPTSGLDVETRRELWNLLQSLRGNRTMLLTTHFMEEADALGDRIAALHHGVLRCHATAMFLKRAIGTGYRLSLTTVGAPNETAITTAIRSIVSDATLRDQKPNGVTYNLPAKDTNLFPKLFTVLEERRTELGIDIIGVGKSTLDDVFVELCSDEKPKLTEESDTAVVDPMHRKETGVKLCGRQFTVLLLRQWHYVTSGLCSLLFITPFLILLLYLVTIMSNRLETKPKSLEAAAMSLDLYDYQPQRRALVNVNDAYALTVLRRSNPAVEFEQVPDIAWAAIRTRREDSKEYEKYILGIELSDTSAKVLHTMQRYAAPVAVNLLSNALAARLLGGDGRTIITHYQPLPRANGYHKDYDNYKDNVRIQDDNEGSDTSEDSSDEEDNDKDKNYVEDVVKESKEKLKTEVWSGHIAFLVFVYMCKFAGLPCAERASGARLAHVLAGCPRALIWTATLTAQLAQALLLCTLPAVICAAAADKDNTFNRSGFLMAMWMLLFLGLLAFLALVYFVSCLAKGKNVTIFLFITVFICTIITSSIQRTNTDSILSLFFMTLADIADFTLPPHTMAHGLQQATNVARANAFCAMNRNKCPDLFGPAPFDDDVCCGSPNDPEPYSYWETEDAAGMCMVTLVIQTVVYLVLMYMSDSGVFSWLLIRMCPRPEPPPARVEDPAARDEAAYVSEAIKSIPANNQITDAVLCHNIRKSFPGCCKKIPFFAVKRISISVKKGECFGLLGVNGAGKSTTFKMLTGETWPSAGDIFSDGQQLRLCNRNKYMHTLSYCPQFFGVDDFLTGRQNLVLLLTLRGLHASDVKAISDSWLKEVGLEQYADKRVSTYSGGCARRLAAAAALCQRARTVLLDEPTAGVDPVARRSMHQALLRARRTGAIVIASHSLDEIEALCHRITIMSGGELRALGSASALKAQYGAGYSIVFKLNYAENVPDGTPTVNDFKTEMQRRFNCTVTDEHQTMLSYQIKDRLRYSELFDSVEGLKIKFPDLIEDYTVTETTLEEVFLAFAKEARAPGV